MTESSGKFTNPERITFFFIGPTFFSLFVGFSHPLSAACLPAPRTSNTLVPRFPPGEPVGDCEGPRRARYPGARGHRSGGREACRRGS